MAKSANQPKPRRNNSAKKPEMSLGLRFLKRVAFFVMLITGASGLGYQLSQAAPAVLSRDQITINIRADIKHDFGLLNAKIHEFEDKQARSGLKVVDDEQVQQDISDVTLNDSLGNLGLARKALAKLDADIMSWNKQLVEAIRSRDNQTRDAKANQIRAAVQTNDPAQSLNVPILIYHYTPADFETQLQYLVSHGYTGISLDQLAGGLAHLSQLPPKPVVITFDDGYEDQMKAFSLLQKYQMPATYYIVTGGAASNWCIGAGRTNAGCGDAYLSWDQVRALDASGLITIAAHTMDHLNLVSLPPDQQRSEIFDGKAQLEAQLGHSVHHFAYPYGSFNATTIALVREAGFLTAVSTIPGTMQSTGNIFTLYRIRSTLKLP